MSLGTAIAAALPLMRAQAESLMVDTCTITRPAGPPTFNADTGQYSDPVAPLTVYTGKCRIRTRTSVLRDRITQAGEAEVVIWPYIVAVPVTDVDVAVLDIVTITASTDPALVGHAMRVRIANLATNATARRLDCEEIA